jgi:hypothetical protein
MKEAGGLVIDNTTLSASSYVYCCSYAFLFARIMNHCPMVDFAWS